MTSPTRPDRTVAIVGGGASGTLVALHLLRELADSGAAAEILLVDRDGLHGLGRAYATHDERHLLNARTAAMSAVAGDPGHFARWAAHHGYGPTDFAPRALYGRYLLDTLRVAHRAAGPSVRVRRITGTVEALRPPTGAGPAAIRVADTWHPAAAVVLATGNPPAAQVLPRADVPGVRQVADPWAPGALAALDGCSRVLVVGSGLTAVDLAITLCARPGVTVHAISRSGLVPQEHHRIPGPPVELNLPDGPLRLGPLIAAVRAEVDRAQGDWRAVLDALRPEVPRIWAALPQTDRHRFLTLLLRTWETHRHRIAPESAARIAELRATGRLRLHRGRLADLAPAGEAGCAVLVDSGVAFPIGIDAVVNATGSGPVDGNPLLARLLRNGLIATDCFGLGLDATADGIARDAAGRPAPWLSTLGPTLRGLRLETTAIPEIRDQAAALARRLAGQLRGAPEVATVGATSSHL